MGAFCMVSVMFLSCGGSQVQDDEDVAEQPTPDRCKSTPECAKEGRCQSRGPKCVAGDAEDCTSSEICKKDGFCSFDALAKECIPDCNKAGSCEQEPCLYNRDMKECVPNCVRMDRCKEKGECTWVVTAEPDCYVTTNDDCQKSTVCGRDGQCSFVNYCTDDGYCENPDTDVAGMFCTAATADDCKASELCASEGRCFAQDGKCVKKLDCAKSAGCKAAGLCKAVDGRCVPGSDKHCAASAACKGGGLCTANGTVCVPKVAKHCEKSMWCREYGMCHFDGTSCVVPPEEGAEGGGGEE